MILHIDMDAFFASVEQRDNPELRGKCVIVGGTSNRGVVCAASYEARRFGVHSAMPVFQARKHCPHGVFIPPRFSRYKEISRKIMSIFMEFTPLVEAVSIDEAYLDVTGCERLHGGAEEIAKKIKIKIRESVHLSCSVGVAPNKFIAKIASDLKKPDGLVTVSPEQVRDFVESLPVGKVPGVGAVTGERLDALGIRTLRDVKKYSEDALTKRLGKFGRRLAELACGIDPSPVSPSSEHKSISSEETLQVDTGDKKVLSGHLLEQSEDVAKQLRKLEIKAKTITLKIKHSDFTQATRSTTLAVPTRSSKILYREALGLLMKYPIRKKIRLIGMGTSNLIPKGVPVQSGLFEEEEECGDKWERVDCALDSITEKFGKSIIGRAALKREEGRRARRIEGKKGRRKEPEVGNQKPEVSPQPGTTPWRDDPFDIGN
jgi:DNA polymerase-4